MKELFEKAGIESNPYARGPAGSGTFIIGLNPSRDVVRYWVPKNNENLEIQNQRFSKKHEQVSFSIVEPRRVLTHDTQIAVYKGNKIDSYSSWRLGSNFNINLPGTTQYKITKHSRNADKSKLDTYNDWYDVTIQATVPASKQHFLVGKDETKLFVSALPKAADSIEDAHKMLRPDGAGPSTPRQGEWFFLPADIDQDVLDVKYIDQITRNNGRYESERISISPDRWGSRNHKASMIVRSKNKTYVKGLVFDTSGRHHNINFPQWMRAVKNKEVEAQTNNTYWD